MRNRLPTFSLRIGDLSHTSHITMAQYFFDLLYNFTDCMCCFPSSPQLKINNRSFKLLRLLGEVRHHPQRQLARLTLTSTGRILLRLSRPRQSDLRALCAEKDPLPLRPRVRIASPQGSRSLQPIQLASEHYPLDRPLRLHRIRLQVPIGWRRSRLQNCLHLAPLLPARQSARCH